MSPPQRAEITTKGADDAGAVKIRRAYLADAGPIAQIYNQGIEDGVATLETETRDSGERLEWLKRRGARHPVLVAERGGLILGWGSLNPFSERAAYRFVADCSIYVARERRGTGIGKRLLDALIERARALEYHKLVLSAFAWNESGVSLYKSRGFREVGIYKEQGQLDGRWVDTLIMENILN